MAQGKARGDEEKERRRENGRRFLKERKQRKDKETGKKKTKLNLEGKSQVFQYKTQMLKKKKWRQRSLNDLLNNTQLMTEHGLEFAPSGTRNNVLS